MFCDLQMPGMDGVEFVRHLARIGYAGVLVLVSGEDERILQSAKRLALAQRVRLLGALPKPVTPDQLARLLGSAGLAVLTTVRAPLPNQDAEALRAGIATGQLAARYQPKGSLSDGRLFGAEALVR